MLSYHPVLRKDTANGTANIYHKRSGDVGAPQLPQVASAMLDFPTCDVMREPQDKWIV